MVNNDLADRLLLLMKEKAVTNYILSKETGLSQATVGRIISKKSKPNESSLKLIANYFNVTRDWLLTGHGPMLRGGLEVATSNLTQSQNEQQGIIQEPQEKYIMATQDRTAERGPCWEKDLIIEGLKTQLAEQKQSLEARLADKDKQIEALERLIASKDEMLAMKEEAVKGKEEIISIQSKRIAELEAQKDTEESKKILGSVERIGQEGSSASDIRPKDLSAKAKKSEYQP